MCFAQQGCHTNELTSHSNRRSTYHLVIIFIHSTASCFRRLRNTKCIPVRSRLVVFSPNPIQPSADHTAALHPNIDFCFFSPVAQHRRFQKSPRLRLQKRQPPQQQPRCTGVWTTIPPQQGTRSAAGERPGHVL